MQDSPVNWQKILAQGFACANELLEFLALPSHLGSFKAQQQFKTRVPRGFAARMQRGNPRDPLLLQVLAVDEELELVNGFTEDPLRETSDNPHQGLLHKYKGRVLLTITGACAVHCRYCFRRHFPYQDNNPGRLGWSAVFDYIRRDPSIHEVIFSGGDPFLATDRVLQDLIEQLDAISHVRTLRFHSRVPIVLPERITDSLLTMFAATRLRKVVVLHSNHAQEIDDQVKKGCFLLRQAGCFLLNQSVLLKGVNDSVNVLAELSEELFNSGVLPYYLHVLDKVAGGAHFDLSEEEAVTLYRQLKNQLPGYLVPRLAREESGKGSKTILI